MAEATSRLRITTEPLDNQRCKFILNRAVHDAGVMKYTSAEEAAESPIAQAALDVPAVCEVVLSGNIVTVVQDGSLPWSALEPQIRYAIDAGLSASAARAAGAAPAAQDDDTIYDTVDEVFQVQINPAVAQHGGKVELLDVQDGTVVLRMMGGCQGCGMANVTLRQGIEAALRRAVPSLNGIKDVTDHAAGTNPYFAAGTK